MRTRLSAAAAALIAAALLVPLAAFEPGDPTVVNCDAQGDDTAALQAAVDAVESRGPGGAVGGFGRGGVVRIAVGWCELSATVVADSHSVAIEGCGRTCSVIEPLGDFDAIRFTSADPGKLHSTIGGAAVRDLGIWRPPASALGGAAIRFRRASGTAEEVSIWNTWRGIVVEGVNHRPGTLIDAVRMTLKGDGVAVNGSRCLSVDPYPLDGGGHVDNSHVRVRGGFFQAVDGGAEICVELAAVDELRMWGQHLFGGDQAVMQIHTASIWPVQDVQMSNSRLETQNDFTIRGFWVPKSQHPYAEVRDIRGIGVSIKGGTKAAVEIDGDPIRVRRFQFVGGELDNGDGDAFKLKGGAHILIDGNVLHGFPDPPCGRLVCIAGATNVTVGDNAVVDDSGVALE